MELKRADFNSKTMTSKGELRLLSQQSAKKVAVELWLLNDATTENGWRYEKLREHMGKFATTPILIAYVGSKIGDGHNFSEEKNPITGEVSPSFMDATAERIVGFFEKKEDVPRKAVSMGIGTIMRAKKIVLLVNGENKAEILKEVVNGPVTPKVPGSILQFHPHVTVICDEEAAKYL